MNPTRYRHLLLQICGLASLFACMLIAPAIIHAEGHSRPPNAPATKSVHLADTTVVLDRHKFDLAKKEDLNAFVQTVKELRALSKEERDEKKEAKQQGEKRKGARDWSGKKIRSGLKAMEHISVDLQKGKADTASAIQDLQEIDWAVESNFLTPTGWRQSVDFGDLLFRTRYILLNASGRGNAKNPALNLQTYDTADLSKIDPMASTFWSSPSTIADKDLYNGFDRKALPNFTDTICTYDSPHKGYGVHPSFEVVWHDTHWKVKFDEERSSGPFACRLFWALGYPVEIVDYTPEIKVRWDRRIISQFNARKLVATQVKLAGIPLTTVRPNRYFDPFHYIQYAVLKDGSHVEAQQLKERLFPVAPGRSRPKRPEQKPSLYDTAFESKIDYLVMKDASVTAKDSEYGQEVGYWDYNNLDHAKLREVRGMAVLDAWLDNWDVRWSNNRLYLTEEKDGTYRLKHVVSDLGALFGNSSGFVRMVHGKLKVGVYQNVPNDYGWEFTHPQPPGRMTVPIRDYMPASKIGAFYEMNRDDARWMARLIGQLTEEQIKTALIASGYNAPVARFLLEKLVARRDRMVQDFELSGEIPLLRPHGVNKKLSYDPEKDGAFEATLPSGRKVAARSSGEYVVVNGVLKRN